MDHVQNPVIDHAKYIIRKMFHTQFVGICSYRKIHFSLVVIAIIARGTQLLLVVLHVVQKVSTEAQFSKIFYYTKFFDPILLRDAIVCPISEFSTSMLILLKLGSACI
jgi:hypothetical protein